MRLKKLYLSLSYLESKDGLKLFNLRKIKINKLKDKRDEPHNLQKAMEFQRQEKGLRS